jgi:hypothetical protein
VSAGLSAPHPMEHTEIQAYTASKCPKPNQHPSPTALFS